MNDQRAQGARVVETHISTLLFIDDRVYKRKKPVKTAFLDFTDLSARRLDCEREVALNRRLAPEVYLGVADVVMDDQCIDHYVVMQRLDEQHRLSARLALPSIAEDLHAIARVVAEFHGVAQGSADVDAACAPDAVEALWNNELREFDAVGNAVVSSPSRALAAHYVQRYLDGRSTLFEQRIAGGFAVDGHGDLQAEDIFCGDGDPQILDCLEFDDRLRYGDTLNDVAFLAMDLERLQHPELARLFMDEYRSESGDSWPTSLEHFYIAYRAHIRAKVACIRFNQGDSGSAETARALHDLALRHLARAQVRLILVGGTPGTGKTSVASRLADEIDAVLLSTDEVRDDLQPRREPTPDKLNEGRYSQQQVDAIYGEILRRSLESLRRGESVVLDASWMNAERREAARAVARETSSMLFELRCICDESTAMSRIEQRRAAGSAASEATIEVALAMMQNSPPWPEAVAIDTQQPLSDAVAAAVVATSTVAVAS